jgi:SRSO17 transposase
VDPVSWRLVFDELMGRVAVRFGRVEPRRTARAFVAGLLSGTERKNCWWLAEWAGHRSPDAMQRLLRTARWDADLIRDDVRGYVTEHLGHRDGVLVADETGFVKKGTKSAGVQRQYSGTAGRVENTQVGVFVAYVSPRGRALIDRALYLPRTWVSDSDRCRAAGIPPGTVFASKPALARQMLARALDAGVPAAWVTADEVYGADPALRAELEHRGTGYVLAIACHRRVTSGGITIRADELAARLPARAWQQLSAGAGAKGPRYYDWAWAGLQGMACHWLLIRRNHATGKLAFYLCWAPRPVPLATLVRVAGSRWAIEESFQAAKGQVGLDHYQVRGWRSWHRFTTLAMLALAFLAVTAATAWPATGQDQPGTPHARALTLAEIRHLLCPLLTSSPRPPAAMLAWSTWRRLSQARARYSHYQRRQPTTSPGPGPPRCRHPTPP